MSFWTLRRVRKGKEPSEHEIVRRTKLNGKLTCCTSSPNLGLILEQPADTSSASLSLTDAGVTVDNQSLSSSSGRDYDEESVAESVETSSSVSISDRGSPFGTGGGGGGRRHKSFAFRQENPTRFVAHASDIIATLPRRKGSRFQGSSPALNSYERTDSGFLPIRRSNSTENYQNDNQSLSSSSSVYSLTPKSEEERRREAYMISGVKKFNWSPKKGIEFFQNHELIGKEAVDVARVS